ncbi:MAG TPA: L-threonylcarbamoyladenylate synthase [Terriglobia bacterium]|nr:L-threonylcarbamoyladenylate synthase [Terriglobia bacterium]
MKVFRAETLHDLDYDEIVALLRDGGIIGFPTDTAYGLGVDPFNEFAVDRLFQVKGRPETKPILLVVDSLAMAESVSRPSEIFYAVAKQFWPGPLTLVVEAQSNVPMKVTAGTPTIGVRWPRAPFATALLKRFGKPITATSANRTGAPSAITAEEIRSQFGDTLDAIIDAGELPARGGSTLLDLTADPPVLLREGPVRFEELHSFFNGRIRRSVA